MSFESHLLVDTDIETLRSRVAKTMRLRWQCSIDNFSSKDTDIYYDKHFGWNNLVTLHYSPQGDKTEVDVKYEIRSETLGEFELREPFTFRYWQKWVHYFEKALVGSPQNTT